jgi:hypothetical protein
VYHYRVHGDSISSQRKAEQDACAAAIRSEYQANYVSPGTSRGALASLSRFWAGDAGVPLESNFSAIDALFGDVRSNFLAYVERRYGIADRTRLAAELDDALRDRLGLWLYLSAKALRRAACRDLLAVVRSRGDTFNISMRALRHTRNAVVRRMPLNR